MKTENRETVFITVGTKKQKALCEKLISDIRGKLNIDIKVVSDDDYGCRIGSGGALINIITGNYNNQKMLIVNSGGVSKRSINYSVRGKAFANVKYKEEVLSLLELIVINAQRLMSSIASGAVVCCSDILLETEDLNVELNDNTGFCVRADFETGSRHGVMFDDKNGKLDYYLHKYEKTELEKFCSEKDEESVLIDTGMVYLNDEFCTALKKASQENNLLKTLCEHQIDLNLYPDIISLLSRNIDKEKYLYSESQNRYHIEVRQLLMKYLSLFSMNVVELENRSFIHFGSLGESLKNIIELSDKKDGFIKLNSHLDEESVVGKNSVLDNVLLENGCKIGSGCLISDVTLDGISVEDGKAVCGIRLSDGSYVTVICDIDENPKMSVGSKELWDIPRFYKGKSFSDSLQKYYVNTEGEKYSLRYCTDNADFDYYFVRRQYLNDMNSYHLNPDYLIKRKEIITEFFQKRPTVDKIKCLHNKVEVLLPVRVNFSGTWTDAMPYCIDNGGQVINAAVTVDGKMPIKVVVEKLQNKTVEFCSDGICSSFSFDNYDSEEDLSDFNLHKAALKTMGITSLSSIEDGFRLTTEVTDIDKGSGLGTSSILLSGCLKALGQMFGINDSDDEIIKMVFVAEQIMKTGGGWQDQVGGLTPCVKSGTSLPGIEQDIRVEHIECSEAFKRMFSERTVLMPTGQRHFGRFIVNDVVNRYLAKNEESLSAHIEIRELNVPLTDSIINGELSTFYDCLNRHWSLLKRISPLVTNSSIDKIVEKCLGVADAVSICGAGGGGYLLVVLKESISVSDFKTFVKDNFPQITSSVKKIDLYC